MKSTVLTAVNMALTINQNPPNTPITRYERLKVGKSTRKGDEVNVQKRSECTGVLETTKAIALFIGVGGVYLFTGGRAVVLMYALGLS